MNIISFSKYIPVAIALVFGVGVSSTPSPTTRTGCRTISGPQQDKDCIFPFVYAQVQHNECTTVENNGIPWCSTKTDGNNNHIAGNWGNCAKQCPVESNSGDACMVTAGDNQLHPCIFPFTYAGVVHNACTLAADTQPWCSTKVDSSGVHIGGEGNWGYCEDKTECPFEGNVPADTTVSPPSTVCGTNYASIVNGIVNGSVVIPHSIPWQVLFLSGGFMCGGTLISDRHVLTAAHCDKGKPYNIFVSEHDIADVTDGIPHGVCRVVTHPNYQDMVTHLINDFAIVRLREPVQLNSKIGIACLPTENMGGDFFVGTTMTVSGWGNLEFGGNSPPVLHSVDVIGITNEVCDTAYTETEVWGGCRHCITDDMLCASAKNLTNGGVGPCHGDSGGPLTYLHGGRAILAGVVSWGYDCAAPGVPGVYARVTEEMDWIMEELSRTC